jgi:hypothetical protein
MGCVVFHTRAIVFSLVTTDRVDHIPIGGWAQEKMSHKPETSGVRWEKGWGFMGFIKRLDEESSRDGKANRQRAFPDPTAGDFIRSY